MIQRLVHELSTFCIFSFDPLVAKPRIRSFHLGVHTYSFRSIAPAVTKHALLMEDDEDRRQQQTTRDCKSGELKIKVATAGVEKSTSP
jgi:hypothetical protein